MTAGASAHYEAQRSLLEAGEHERLAQQARQQAARYEIASRSEAVVGARLQGLRELGWSVFADRRWAGSKRANVDFLLVGPGGIVVVDVKAWRALEVRHGSLFCEDECRDDEAHKLLGLVDRVQDSVAALGITAAAVHPALVFYGQRLDARAQRVSLVGEENVASWVTRLGHRFDDSQVQEVAAVLAADFPAYGVERDAPIAAAPVHVVVPRAVTSDDALFDVDELASAILERHLAGPIEEWMTVLHPDQLRLVHTSWSGPARLRGPAGTGKTVVGLHRAVHLAERTGMRVLVVTFVRTLPVVLSRLCQRLAPQVEGEVDFSGLHQLAGTICERAGVRSRVDGRRIGQAYDDAWATVGRETVLARLNERASYWREEIDYVIKGRGLREFADYAALARVGRRTPMRAEHRAAMWELYVEYERRLHDRGVWDFNDLLLVARDLVRRDPSLAPYGAVIVDEVQDLPLVGLELLHAIAGDGPDGLLLIGDGQQNVYPGGFRLNEAGISVAGRANVLRVNYRNTAEILDAAAMLVASDGFDDLDGEIRQGQRETTASRHGPPPLIVRSPSRSRLEGAMIAQIRATQERLRVPLGDMAVLARTRRDVDRLGRILTTAGLDWVDLLDYDGMTTNRLKIGTFKRAKGLEFKYVLLPNLTVGSGGPWAGESEDAYQERVERDRRELFVGMTRARDGLWLGYLEPNPTR
ncbi:nuclease-related domain-containing DEAD/DEAH box helicase [Nocardioides sp.]|uniref:nuclease-related domain-containing DEAD/DEAH box helicase n=1 Tax=Nocardioides sp. TaxID=35761 RepID=UPI002EDAC23B